MKIAARILVITGVMISPSALAAKVIMLTPDDIKWEPFGLWQRAVLAGEPARSGCPSTVRVKFPAGARVPEHVLEQDESFTVLSGTLQVGLGEKWDDAVLKAMSAGAFYSIPAGTSSFKTSQEEVVYQVSVIGPGGEGCPKTGPVAAVMLEPEDFNWESYGKSARRAILLGNKNKFHCPPYTGRSKLTADTRISEHESDEDRIYTVLSGTLYVGIGTKWNDKALKRMPAGSFFSIPAGVSRYFKTEEETELQASVTGLPRHGAELCK